MKFFLTLIIFLLFLVLAFYWGWLQTVWFPSETHGYISILTGILGGIILGIVYSIIESKL